METPFDTEFVADAFNLDGSYVGYKVKNDGHINSTYVIEFEKPDGRAEKYTLQKINTYVFKDTDKLMSNIVGVTSHIKEKLHKNNESADRRTLTFLPAKDGKYYAVDKNGDCWRCYDYIDNAYTCNIIDSADVFYNAGKSFGNFQNLLSDYPIDGLFETIPKFHDTYSRFNDFLNSVKRDASGRAATAKDEIQWYCLRSFKRTNCRFVLRITTPSSTTFCLTTTQTRASALLTLTP